MATSTSEAVAETKFLTLKSYDGEEFQISESAADLSATLKHRVEEGYAGDVIPLPNIDSKTLSKIVVYLEKHADAAVSRDDLKIFDNKFYGDGALDDLFACLEAANYLSINGLIELLCLKIADAIKYKSVEEIQQLFNITDFLEKKEVEKIKAEYPHAFIDITKDS